MRRERERERLWRRERETMAEMERERERGGERERERGWTLHAEKAENKEALSVPSTDSTYRGSRCAKRWLQMGDKPARQQSDGEGSGARHPQLSRELHLQKSPINDNVKVTAYLHRTHSSGWRVGWR